MKKLLVGVVSCGLGISAMAVSMPSTSTQAPRHPEHKDHMLCPGGAEESVAMTLVSSRATSLRDGVSFTLQRNESDKSRLGAFELEVLNASGKVVVSSVGEWSDDTREVGSIALPADLASGVYFVHASVSGLVGDEEIESQEVNQYIRVDGSEVRISDFNDWMTNAVMTHTDGEPIKEVAPTADDEEVLR
jgi:hypothetical protein